MLKKVVYLLATILLLQCCASSLEVPLENPPASKVLPNNFIYITPDVDPYPAIGSINYATNEKLIGTGVLIAPDLVLTAAHVPQGKGDVVWIETDGDVICISEIIYYPEDPLLPHDIAIIVLEEESNETPIELINPSKTLIWKRMPLTTVGHGRGVKRYSSAGVFWYYGRLISHPQFMIMLPLIDTIWFGDSGGAVLTPDNKLIGIMSYFAVYNDTIYENGCASVVYYRNWIEGVKNERILERMVE